MWAACFAAYWEEILAGRCDAFFVRINKGLTVHQKRMPIKQVERDLEEAAARHPCDLSKNVLRMLLIHEEMERLQTIGRWNDQ